MEIAPPDRYIYAILDMTGVSQPGQFTEIKLKLKNTTPNDEEMEGGKLIAVARYLKPTNDNFDPSQQHPTWEDIKYEYIYSVSAENTSPLPGRDGFSEYTFNFTDSPIPTNAIDLTLQVIYQGKLGNEGDSVAVGMVDLYEPDNIDIWNNTDYFCNDGTLIRSNYDNDLDGDGEPDLYCSPTPAEPVYVSFSKDPFPPGVPQTDYAYELGRIEPGEYKTIAILQDTEDYYYSATYYCIDPNPGDDFPIWEYVVCIGRNDVAIPLSGVDNKIDVHLEPSGMDGLGKLFYQEVHTLYYFEPRAFRDKLTHNALIGFTFTIGEQCDGYDWSSEANLP